MGSLEMSSDLTALLMVLCAGAGCPSVVLLLRDVDTDDYGPQEQRRVAACIDMVQKGLNSGTTAPNVKAWLVMPLANLGPTELSNEVKSLRKARALPSPGGGACPA